MNVYFAYTVGAPDVIYYGKYFGSTTITPNRTILSEKDLLDVIFPRLKQCYSIDDRSHITISILSSDNKEFTDRDPFKYNFVYCDASPVHVYLNGTIMN